MKTSRFVAFVGVLMFMFSLNWMPQPQAESKSNCQHISGHIAGQVYPPPFSLCDGAITETGTFTDSGGNTLGTFVACVTSLQQEGEGAFKLQLAHTYTTNSGDTFTTSDSIVLSPINPPIYRVDNRAHITGGTGVFQDASGFILDEGTFNFQTGMLSVDFHGQICTPQ
jgi:hypothetical protein